MKNDILKRTLTGPEPLEAAEAARLIGEWNGRELIPDLIEHARTHRFYSKTTTFYALARLGAKEAIPQLTQLVADPNVSNDWYWYGSKGVRAAAAVSLLQLGSDAGVAHLLELAEKKENVFYRWFAPALLRLKGPKELISYLTLENLCPVDRQTSYDAPEFSEPGMLCMLAEALGLVDDPAAEARLEFYFGHYSRFLRGQAYRSLYLRRPDKATAQKIAENAKKHGTDFDRIAAAEVNKDGATLAEIARRAPAAFDRACAIDALAVISSPSLLEAGTGGLNDGDVYVRQCAVEALGRHHKAEAQKLFSSALKNEKETRVLCALAATQLGGEKRMKLGVGTAVISPKVWDKISASGMGRQEKTRGVLEDLTLQVFVLQEKEQTAVVCVMDQLFSMVPEVEELTKRCHARLPKAHFLLCASHVHSSTAAPHMFEKDRAQAEKDCTAALQLVFEGFSEALDKAMKNPREVEMASGRFFVEMPLGLNRRAKLGNGTCITAWDNGATIPPGQKCAGKSSEDAKWIDVLAFREPGKTEPMAILSSYASHVHLYEIPYFTDEAAGSARRAVEKRHPGLTLMYSLGCCGNIALGFAHPIPQNDEESRIAWYKEKSKVFGEAFADVLDENLGKLKYEPVHEMKYTRFHKSRPEREESLTVETLRLGQHAICAIPGEIFIEFDADLRRDIPAESLLVMTYNNSFLGYIATALGFEEGSYETMRGTAKEAGYISPNERIKSDLTTGDSVVSMARGQLAELFAK